MELIFKETESQKTERKSHHGKLQALANAWDVDSYLVWPILNHLAMTGCYDIFTKVQFRKCRVFTRNNDVPGVSFNLIVKAEISEHPKP